MSSSGGASTNNDSTLAGFLLSAGIVTPAATQNTGATQNFLQQIGFCSSEAQAIAAALKQQGLAALTTSTGPAPISVSPGVQVTVPAGWLGNVGAPKPLAKLPGVSLSGPVATPFGA